ncbi:MAG: hypothetical protein DMG89_07755 [Acidobacteria bacterium]|nr:MAG: hypothetical protein DMG89_07755 [Acidobacteriota bacterium]
MQAIDADCLDWVEVFERSPFFVGKRYITPYISHTTARLQAAQHIALRQLLVLDTHERVSKDA